MAATRPVRPVLVELPRLGAPADPLGMAQLGLLLVGGGTVVAGAVTGVVLPAIAAPAMAVALIGGIAALAGVRQRRSDQLWRDWQRALVATLPELRDTLQRAAGSEGTDLGRAVGQQIVRETQLTVGLPDPAHIVGWVADQLGDVPPEVRRGLLEVARERERALRFTDG